MAMLFGGNWADPATSDSVSTIAAFALDIYVHRKNTSRGMYRLQDMDTKTGRPQATRGPFTDGDQFVDDHGNRRESEAWEAPRGSTDPHSERAESLAGRQGYAVPEDQFNYDTGYNSGQQHMR